MHVSMSLVYRPPSGNVVTFLQFFEPFLDYASMNNLKLVCGGDLNIDVLKQSNSSFQLNLCLLSAGFVNTITTPTRITSHTSSLLDLLIVDISTTVCNTGTLVSDISDHCPIFLIYTDDSKKTADACQQFTYQRITQASLEQFKNDVMNHNWSHVLNKTDANKAYNEFIRAFTHMYASNFPMKTAKHSKKVRKPWVTHELAKMIKTKNNLYHSFLRTRCELALQAFKKFRSRLNAELRKAKAAYLFANVSRQRPEIAWQTINLVLGRRKDDTHLTSIKLGSREAEHFPITLTTTS